jgi:regulator of protease activity HflC (stomatin/prohibitin superfamily)
MAGNATKGRGLKPWQTTLIAVVALLGVCLCLSVIFLKEGALVTIKPDERGVVISVLEPAGYRPEALGPGLHWISPIAERVVIFSTAPQTYTTAAISGAAQSPEAEPLRISSRDGQQIAVSAAVTYSVDPADVVELNLNWQDRYQDGVVRPLTRGIVRDTLAQYTADEIMGAQREAIDLAISDQLSSSLAQNDLLFIAFAILDTQRMDE